MSRTYDTYLQELLCEGDIDSAYVTSNEFQVPIPSEDMESPLTFITKKVLILKHNDIPYDITEEQLEIEKDLMLSKYPDIEETITSNYNALKDKMEVSE